MLFERVLQYPVRVRVQGHGAEISQQRSLDCIRCQVDDHLAPVALPFLHKTLGIVHHPVVGACTDFSDSESLRQGENLSFRRVNHVMMGSSFCSRRKLLLNLPPRVFFSSLFCN